jgi:Chaperone of endosialidase
MNPLIQLKQITSIFLVAFGLACFALSPAARAVSPPPDGGYPGFNTAEGQNALLSLTTGQGNTGVGWFSLWTNATGEFNTATGAGALLFNNGDPTAGEASENTAFGAAALLFNTTGSDNTAVGAAALLNNTEGGGNTANGSSALQNNTIGIGNTATGADALFFNTGSANTANGAAALLGNTIGNFNTATGFSALSANMTGNGNTAIGRRALTITTGSGNTAFGANAGSALTTGDNNIDIGVDVIGVAGESNTIRIGANLPDTPGASACHIGGIYQQTVDPSTVSPMEIDATGKLGTVVSSRRFKHDIKPMDKASEAILALKPVTFHYKSDAKNTPCFGLIAEEVAEVNPDLVVRNKDGDIYTVRYDQVNAMLLNEFLKEHSTVQELKKEVAALTATVNEQSSQIQKVTAQLELNKPTQTIVNNQ